MFENNVPMNEEGQAPAQEPAKKKTVVIYDTNDIENALGILDTQTPVVGIKAMQKIIEVFNIIKSKGFVQEVDAEPAASEYFPGVTEENANQDVTLASEGEPLYNASDVIDEVPVAEYQDVNEYDGQAVETVEPADEIID